MAMDEDNDRLPLRSFGIEKVSPKGTTIHWIPDVDESIKPVLFSRFKSVDAAYTSYKEYGKKGGFEGFLPEKKQQKEKQQCEKQQGENGDDNKKKKRNRPSSRCGCEAKICLRLTRDNNYELYGFEEKHNDSLVHPDDRHYLKSSRKLNYSDKTLLVKMSNRNIGPVVAYNILTEIHGGFDKVGALPQDAKNFKRDILAYLTFVEFFSHFETDVQTQRFIQGKNDHDTRYTTPKIETTLPFEKEAIHIYTRKVFVDVVQKEMLPAVHACYSIGVVSLDESRSYTILDTDVRVKKYDDNGDEIIGGHHTIEVEYKVEYKELDGTLQCTCRYFESRGLLCRHIFYVLRILKVNCFPKRYIQRRWTRDCVPVKSSEASTIRHGLGETQETSGALIRDIYYIVDATINRLLSDNAKLAAYRMVQKELLEKADAETENQPVMGNKEFIHLLLDLPEIDEDDDTILPCEPTNDKGSRKRLKNAYEEASTKKQKQTRNCSKCGKTGHNSRTCE
ncbi:FAR1 DNA binding domain, Zinc finger, SWIM-type, MULE transposase domain, FHY3/FAR1 family [Artemisia annua]|uniref:FAR1 DNA binding domain, Zinc finger, SWIM-type, MULE transposase domain, FHY3/FAR1 family n=1 Tax=Artemisia annua TaxID=35608 RepID=A0A2U1N0C7_ARTAN|nr:FAR1 DNA binding domain, Zinc finger, SWIM-type, MULE transposase domain, FHY3/FAR1 family [Artemisia annua]